MNFSSLLATVQNGSFSRTAPAQGAAMPPGAPKSHVDLTYGRVWQGAGIRQRIPQSSGIVEGVRRG